MRGIGARALSASQVIDWYTSRSVPVGARPGSGGYLQEILADSPNLYLNFDGTTATDISGNGYSPSGSGGAWTTGEPPLIGGGFSWKALGNQYQTYTQTALVNTASVTVEGWIKPVQLLTYAPIWDSDNSAARRFQLCVTGGVVRFIWWTTSSGPHIITGATGISTNTRYHVAATYDSATGGAKIYVNGAQDATGSSSAIAMKVGNYLAFGVGSGGSSLGAGGYFNGWIDEYAYFPTALSSARILAHYNAGTGK